jgi:hypothetical protein
MFMNKIYLVVFTQANQIQVIEQAFADYDQAVEYRRSRQLESSHKQTGEFEIEIVDYKV